MIQPSMAEPQSLWQLTDPIEKLEITTRAAQAVARGNLWIFSNEIVRKPSLLKPGAWCEFYCGAHRVGAGYVNPHSLIAGRVVSFDSIPDIRARLEHRLEQSFHLRSGLQIDQSARLVFSEADFIPGLIIDYFSGALVLQSNTAGIDAVMGILEDIVPEVFKKVFKSEPRAFIVRADSGIRRLEGVSDFSKIVFGDKEKLAEGVFYSDGIAYAADFLEGQKTGFFLDQRDNRRFLSSWINKLASSKSSPQVLDLFCYSGGWGLAALKSGAASVTFVDESEEALRLLRRGLELNGFNLGENQIQSDGFDFLEKDTQLYDMIVVDPPAFVKSKKNLPQALKAYEKLNRLAWRRLKPSGILMTSSCSYHLGESDFLEILKTAVAKERGLAQIVYRGGQAADHPVLLSMPETRYLKCIGLRKINLDRAA